MARGDARGTQLGGRELSERGYSCIPGKYRGGKWCVPLIGFLVTDPHTSPSLLRCGGGHCTFGVRSVAG